MLTAQQTKHVSTRNARILVQDYVVSMQNAMSETTSQFVSAYPIILGIHLASAIDHQQLQDQLRSFSLVTHHLAEQMLSVQREGMLPLVDAFLTILGILMLSASLSAQSTQSAQETRLASTITVKTLVQECVDNTPPVEWQIIFLNVLVILDIQETHLSHVLVSQHLHQFLKE